MGWNDHHPAIDPGDPDPRETLLEHADLIRKQQKEEGLPCITCGENSRTPRCPRCNRNLEEERHMRDVEGL